MHKANDTNNPTRRQRGSKSTFALSTALAFLLVLSSNAMAQKVPIQSNRQLVQAKRMPGKLLTDRFGVSPALNATTELGAGYTGDGTPGGFPFDWPSLAPTLNLSTVDWTESDWIGQWDTLLGSTHIDHTPADGKDQDWIPSGGEPYDVEAIYFDNDADSFYVAIITSMAHNTTESGVADVGIHDPRVDGNGNPTGGIVVRPGDLQINTLSGPATIENNGTVWHYDYGVDVTHENRDVRDPIPNWAFPQTYELPRMRDLDLGNELWKTSSFAGGSNQSNPPGDWYTAAAATTPGFLSLSTDAYWEQTNFDPQSVSSSATFVGNVRSDFYELDFGGVLENDYPTYVYEFAIPRALFGVDNPGDGEQIGFRLMPGCRNDGEDILPNVKLFGTVDDPELSVELAEFDVATKNGNALLTWATASEENNVGFSIEYAIRNASFVEETFVEGYGTTQDRQEYSYTITNLSPDIYRFRLKQVDIDGSYEYSPIVEATVDLPDTFVLEAAYPNPFNPSTNIRFAVQNRQPVTLKLYDLMGREIRVLFEGVPNTGESLLATVDAAGLQSGSYIVRLEGEEFTSAQKITLLK